MSVELWVVAGTILVLGLVGFAIVEYIDRLDRAERRQLHEGEGGAASEARSSR